MVRDIDIHAIHSILEGLNIPIDAVHRHKDGHVEVYYLPTVTDTQRSTAEQIVREWDQDRYEREGAAGITRQITFKTDRLNALPTEADIQSASKVADLKDMALALRAFIDEFVH